MDELALNIKKYRKLAKMTQKELAKSLGVAPTAISAWEVGRNKPLMDNIRQMALIFGVSEYDILKQHPPFKIYKIDRNDKKLSIKFTFNEPDSDETVEYFFKLYQANDNISAIHGAQFSIKIINVVSTPNNATIERIIDNLATPIYTDRNSSKFTDFSVLLQAQIHQLLSRYLYVNNDFIIIENENVNSELRIEYPVAFTIYSMTGDYLGMTSFLYKFQDPNPISS